MSSYMSVRRSVRQSVAFLKKLPLEYQMVAKTYLPSNLSDYSESSDSSESSESSDSSECRDSSDKSDGKKLFLKKLIFPQKTFCFHKKKLCFTRKPVVTRRKQKITIKKKLNFDETQKLKL